MEIAEIRDIKIKLEQDVCEMLQDFTYDTGVEIKSVDYTETIVSYRMIAGEEVEVGRAPPRVRIGVRINWND